jgi:hypothetical protein
VTGVEAIRQELEKWRESFKNEVRRDMSDFFDLRFSMIATSSTAASNRPDTR